MKKKRIEGLLEEARQNDDPQVLRELIYELVRDNRATMGTIDRLNEAIEDALNDPPLRNHE